MVFSVEFTPRTIESLHRRSVSDDDISKFHCLLATAREQQQADKSARQILQAMDNADLALLQKANALAERICVTSLSVEGAVNLLRQPDFSESVDLNNDGLVEVGVALVFPPVNAPTHVKEAWGEATAHMKEGDKMLLMMQMHLAVYGIVIDGVPTKQPLPPQQQWDMPNVEVLFDTLRLGLKERVKLEGWTEHNLLRQNFYDEFERALLCRLV